MGNSPSVEAPGRGGSKAAHKLSKPRTGNAATAGLLSPQTLPDLTQHSTSNARRLSQPSASTPAPSPKLPGKDAEAMASLVGNSNDGEPGDRSSRRISRSDSLQGPLRHQQRSNSVGVIASSQVRCRPIRANSVNIGPEESYAAHFNLLRSLSKNGSRTSVTYDLSSYEARRLLNLAEEPRENNPMIPDSYFQVSEAAWNTRPGSHRPSVSSTAPSLPRAHSDVSLYTPMRRKSLMTPGVATRTTPICPVPSIPSKSRARYSLPSTPSRRDSLESTAAGIASIAPSIAGPDLIPRALTPCEAEYKQTGAFKLGTLRITNGSPVTSPTADSSDEEDDKQGPKQPSEQGSYCHGGLKVVNGNVEEASFTAIGAVGVKDRPIRPSPINASSSPMVESGGSILTTAAQEPIAKLETPGQFSPNLVQTPLPISGLDLESSELQVTSKHTAAEDQLFEDGPQEYDAEVLDIRVDPSAKSLPLSPRLLSNDRGSKEISRSDSGIVASPTSESSQKPLSKADSGYSSNVSLRSLSSKVRGKEKESPQGCSSETPSEIPRGGVSAPVVTQPVTRSIPNVTISKPEENVQSPLPEKVCAAMVPANQRASQELPATSRRRLRLLGSKSSLRKSAVPAKGNLEPPEVSPLSSTSSSAGSTSSLRTAVSPRKLGKLQRLLSGTRAPLTVHSTHHTENTDVPPVPKDVQAKSHGQSGLLPISFKRFTLKPEPSKETLGTIMSVGSAELLHELETPAAQGVRDGHQRSSRKDVKTRGRRSTMHAYSITSTISRAASVLSRRRINKKAVPRPVDPEHQAADSFSTAVMREINEAPATGRITMGQSIVGETLDFAYLSTAIEGRDYVEPISKRSRSTSMTVQIERNLKPSLTTFQPSEGTSQGESRSPASLGVPQFASHITGYRTPPPVSMRTRNTGSLQVLPPTRPRSTPPGTVRAHSGPSLSRKASRESSHRNAPVMDPTALNSGIISRPSRENTNDYSFAQAEADINIQYQEPSLDPRRFTSFRNQFRAPNWEIHADHDPSLSQRTSLDRSRHNSLVSRSSQRSQRSLSVAAPGSFQRQQQQQSNLPILKPRSSHDGIGYLQPKNYVRDNGPYPSMVRPDGQKFVSDPWSGQPVLQQSQQFDLYGQRPSHGSRGHFQHHSLDRNIPEAPYRVLHSYNSPAYRNVPIWG